MKTEGRYLTDEEVKSILKEEYHKVKSGLEIFEDFFKDDEENLRIVQEMKQSLKGLKVISKK